jgi:hypothetical protein
VNRRIIRRGKRATYSSFEEDRTVSIDLAGSPGRVEHA